MRNRPSILPLMLSILGCGGASAGGAVVDAGTTFDAPAVRPDARASTVSWTTAPVDAPGVMQIRFSSAAAGTDVTFHVLVPDAYASSSEPVPVLYFLHGTGAGTVGVEPLSRHFADAIGRGDLAPMLVVFPYGLEMSLWVDDRDGDAPVETVVVREIVPLVDAMFRTDARPERRFVEGFSMGGYGALRYGLVYPEVFGAISALAPGPLQTSLDEGPPANAAARARLLEEVFGGDASFFRETSPWVLAERRGDALREGTPLQVVTGTADAQLPWVEAFHLHLVELDIPHDYIEVPGVDHEVPPLLAGLGPARWTFFERALAQ
jgi:enterochelin esterase-like enzyme